MKIETITIVGGGSSGWMAATALLNKCPELKVTLIESPDIKSIGVGESTIPGVTSFMTEYMGFEDEKDWMSSCDATYKTSIRFQKFKDNNEDIIYHPFIREEVEEDNYSLVPDLINTRFNKDYTLKDLYAPYFLGYHMSEQLKFSKHMGEHWHAHHLDADKLAEYCKNKCKNKGINYIQDTVVEVSVDKENNIKKLRLNNGQVITSDIYFDCTGFSALLISKTLKDPFIDITNTLLNDRAIATRVPYKNKDKEMEPFTDGIALSSGWVWNVPLWSRIGTGYVYSSKFKGKEDAEIEFKSYLIDKFDNERVKDLEFRHIKIRAGRHQNPWKSNCVSTVLSTGFVEPLESTGLYLTVYQIKTFIDTIISQNYNYNNSTRIVYNDDINNNIDAVVDFINLHYINTNRIDSPYWKYISNNSMLSDNLLNILREVKKGNLEIVDEDPIFHPYSWNIILKAFGFINVNESINPERFYRVDEKNNSHAIKESEISKIIQDIENAKTYLNKTTSSMLNHYQYLKENIHGRDSNS